MKSITCDKCGKEEKLSDSGLADGQWAWRKGKDLCPGCLAGLTILEEKLADHTNEAINTFLGL